MNPDHRPAHPRPAGLRATTRRNLPHSFLQRSRQRARITMRIAEPANLDDRRRRIVVSRRPRSDSSLACEPPDDDSKRKSTPAKPDPDGRRRAPPEPAHPPGQSTAPPPPELAQSAEDATRSACANHPKAHSAREPRPVHWRDASPAHAQPARDQAHGNSPEPEAAEQWWPAHSNAHQRPPQNPKPLNKLRPPQEASNRRRRSKTRLGRGWSLAGEERNQYRP